MDWRTAEHWVEGVLVDDGDKTGQRREAIMKDDLKLIGVAGGVIKFKSGVKIVPKTIFVLCWVAGNGTHPEPVGLPLKQSTVIVNV